MTSFGELDDYEMARLSIFFGCAALILGFLRVLLYSTGDLDPGTFFCHPGVGRTV